jgi:hypothetical protein
LLEQLKEDGGLERAQREVAKRCNIVAKALLLFDGSNSLLRTDHKDLTPQHIPKRCNKSRGSMTDTVTICDP